MGNQRILSRNSELFEDRREAGKLLAEELVEYRGKNALVLGIPRGGIIVARELALALEAELDIVLAHKLRTPGHPELAMGSVAEDGQLFLNKDVLQEAGVSDAYIQQEKTTQMGELKRRSELIRRVRPKASLAGRIVIITDDGVATGATMQAALWAAKPAKPLKLIAALPVGPEDTIARLADDVDEIVCLRCPPFFAAVGQFYRRFEPIQDEAVMKILRDEQGKKTGSKR